MNASPLRRLLHPASPVILALAVLGYSLAAGKSFPPLLVSNPNVDVGSVAMGVFVLTLIIERAVEILLGIQRDVARAPLQQTAETVKAEADQIKALAASQQKARLEASSVGDGPRLEALAQLGVDETTVKEKEEAAAKALEAKTKFDKETAQQAAALAFILALIAGLLGVRLLSSFWTLPPVTPGSVPPPVSQWFTAFDIFVTSALVSGGSQGLHLLLSSIGSHIEQAKARKPVA